MEGLTEEKELSLDEKASLGRDAASIIGMTTVDLIQQEPFFASVLMRLNREQSWNTPTIGVVFRDQRFLLIYNPLFVVSLESKHLVGVLKHEIYHIIYDHLARSDMIPDIDMLIFNIAGDIAINSYLRNELPDWVVTVSHPSVIKYNLVPCQSTEFYYGILKQHDDEINNLKSNFCYDGDPNSGGNSDVHMWGHNNVDSDAITAAAKELIGEAYEESKGLCRTRGTLPRDIIQNIEKFLYGQSKLPWNVILKRLISRVREVNTIQTRMRPNRRFGYIRPGNRPDSKTIGTAILDVSASVNNKQFMAFLNELPSINRILDEFYWIQCDASPRMLGKYNEKAAIKRLGNGGTKFAPAIYAAVEDYKPDVIIYLTDGECPWDFEPPRGTTVIWVITNTGITAPSEHGRTVHLEV